MHFLLIHMPVFPGWPDAPCAYLQFTSSYDEDARQAQELGWLYHKIEAGHFHMLVDPVAVTDAILELTASFSPEDNQPLA